MRLRRLVPSAKPLLLAVVLSAVLGLGTWSIARSSCLTAGDPAVRTEHEEPARTWAWRVSLGSLLLLVLWLTHRDPGR